MGCAHSKLDDLPAVKLCRERCNFLEEAIRQRYALSEAHSAYMETLKTIGHDISNFFTLDPSSTTTIPIPPPIPNSDKDPHHHLRSHSGSHLQFDSEDDDDDVSSIESPLHHHHIDDPHNLSHYVHSMDQAQPQGGMHINYMKNRAMPSVSYEMSPDTMHIATPSSYYPPPYSSTASYNDAGNAGGAYYGMPHAEASSSKPPPPMPSPEIGSAWDIFNPFEYDKYFSAYTPSRDSREVRAEEGIPDLEDEDYRSEIVKEVYEDRNRFLHHSKLKKKVVNDDEDMRVTNHEHLYRTRPGVSVENEGMEYDVHVVDKKIVDNDKSEDHINFKARKGSTGVSEALKEIRVQFEKASESGNELAMMLEVGKLQYNRKHGSAYQVSSKMLNVISPSLSVASSNPFTSSIAESSSSASNADSTLLGFEEETGIRLKNLSSTLQKLYIWEKKLYHEVKAEEKMRVVRDRKCQKLKRLDEKGAEAHKAEITRTLIRSLATKIKIAIQVVDKISVNINKIRDEELWPLLYELIQGLTRMWKSMLECHRAQCQAIKEAKGLDAIASHKRPTDAQLEVTKQLEHELIGWALRFSNWVEAQKGCIISLNNWLLKCLHVEPEETANGIAPFSPGRIGAPPVFVICNQWAQALERISEREVVNSMRLFANTVLQFWERDKLIVRQSMTANKDFDKRVKILDRDDHKLQKQIQALEKRVVMIAGDANSISEQSVYQSDTSSVNSLQASPQHILEVMERFTATSTKAYEEILQRNEEDNRVARERENAGNVS